MCVIFRIFVCEAKKEKAHIYSVQKYTKIWTIRVHQHPVDAESHERGD